MSALFHSYLCGRLAAEWLIAMTQRQYDKYRNLGLNIAYYRKQRGLSQIQLAEMVDISRTHMSRIEIADCAVSLDVVFDICDALKISPDKLFDFRE